VLELLDTFTIVTCMTGLWCLVGWRCSSQ